MFQEKDRPSQADLTKLIKAFGSRLTHFGPRKAEETKALATMFNLEFPSDYRQFLGSYGAVEVDSLQIFGLVDPDRADMAVENIILMLRLTYMDMPLELIPVEDLGNNHYACLVCPEQQSADSPVVIIDIENLVPLDQLTVLAPGFRDYVYNRLLLLLEPSLPVTRNEQNTQKALRVFEEHILRYHDQFQYDHAKGGKLPRNHDWRPYRYCIQDVLFGAVVVRHLREANCLQVDVFLTAEIPEYDPLAGALALTTFLLSEAYKCGGSMEIRFTEYVEGKRIPFALCQLAENFDSPFQPDSINQGRISPKEARNLFANLTGFSSDLRERIDELDAQRRLSVERVCYSIHHGVWTLGEIESIVLSSPYPDIVLSGDIQPEQRHLYSHVLFQARSSLLGGFLDRKIASREHVDESGAAFDLEDDERNIIIEFEAAIYAKWYSCPDEAMPVPWLFGGEKYIVNPSDNIVVLIRARDAVGIKQHLAKDIGLVGERAMQSIGERYFILVPFDFNDPYISDNERQTFVNLARSKQIRIIVCPESTFTLDAEVRKRFMSSRIMRE